MPVDALDLALMCDEKYSETMDKIEEGIENLSDDAFESYQKTTSNDDTSYNDISVNAEEMYSFSGGSIDQEVEELIDDMIDDIVDTDGSVVDSVAGLE